MSKFGRDGKKRGVERWVGGESCGVSSLVASLNYGSFLFLSSILDNRVIRDLEGSCVSLQIQYPFDLNDRWK
jgi:hypothetical protein